MSLKPFNRYFIAIMSLLLFQSAVKAQEPEKIYRSYIATAQLYQYGDQTKMPIYNLQGSDRFELEFDDLEANYKSY